MFVHELNFSFPIEKSDNQQYEKFKNNAFNFIIKIKYKEFYLNHFIKKKQESSENSRKLLKCI
ncbi:hypothetical protein BpHYR1_026183 [Brachionus plicatilis]|uniref:Uncharacterized protein n=1 Tax=Brachionus plicatilis TaxID=10195 RepID=A0A3M7T8T5_BRAPC|nr:hypothetical protein BpHYR1_026183 [Brachionus plicatilis]